MKNILRIIVLFSYLALMQQAFAFESFIVKNIKIEGIKRLSKDAVLQDLPIEIGQTVTPKATAEAIRALFQTGFFQDVALERQDQILIIKLVERQTIGVLDIKGIKGTKDPITKILKNYNIAEGRAYSKSALTQAEAEIEKYYLSSGRYNVKVETTVSSLDKERVTVKMAIFAGAEAKIKEIKIIGNVNYKSSELLKKISHKTTNWLSWYNKSDRYAKEKLLGDLEILRSFYMDRGFLNFQVDSTQVSLSPDKQNVYITINITEGAQYKISDVALSGKFVVSKQEMQRLVDTKIKPDDIFSRKELIEAQQLLEEYLGEYGYSKATVQIYDTVDEDQKLVKILYSIDPFKIIHVRKVEFVGNNLTEDAVLRRGIEQLEASRISTKKIKEGKEYIQRNAYAGEVEIEFKPIADKEDQVDVVYKIEEQRTSQFSAGISYSAAESLMFSVNADFKNFLGTGKDINFGFERSKVTETYSLGYDNPFFYSPSIGFGYNLYKQKTNLSKVTNVFEYATDSIGGDVHWSFRVSQYNYLGLALGYDQTDLKFNRTSAPLEALKFANKYNNKLKFHEYTIATSFRHNSLDSYMFPNRGLLHGIVLKASVPPSDLKWYRADYEVSWFRPVWRDIVYNIRGDVGYADAYSGTIYPFYKNYFLGGTDSIRGFREKDLGPRSSLQDPLGGNFKVMGRMQLISPPPFLPDAKNMRVALFVEGGQVYLTNSNTRIQGVTKNPHGLRFTTGVSWFWNTPLHIPISLSFAVPLNKKVGDGIRKVGITFGAQLM